MNRTARTTRLSVNYICLSFILTFCAIISSLSVPVFAQTLPVPPAVFLDTTYAPPTTGQTIIVPAGGDFQAALNAAQPGDIIQLQAGATYTGNFTLPNKAGTGWIYIQSSAIANLPLPGTRVTPNNAIDMPKIVSPVIVDPITQVQTPQGPAIITASAAHHYRFVGVEITTTYSQTGATVYNLVELGSGLETIESDLPSDIVFDRSYLHGTSTGNVRRGIFMGGKRTAVIDSYLSDFHEVGADSQAILPCTGPGPFKIVNNYLEGAGENVMFGGCDPRITGLVPSDIEIRRNYFFKPLTWRVGDPSYAGIEWTVKNLFELKNAQRVLVEGNIFEQTWAHGQPYAIVLTVRNQDGGCPWCAVKDVTFQKNIVRHAPGAFNIHGTDNNSPSTQTDRILIKDNLIYDIDIDPDKWRNLSQLGPGCCTSIFQLLNNDSPDPARPGGIKDLVINHNTGRIRGDASTVMMAGSTAADDKHQNLTFQNNLLQRGNFGGVRGSGTGEGTVALDMYATPWTFVSNVIIGAPAASYPADNQDCSPAPETQTCFPATDDDVGFVDWRNDNYRLSTTSPYNDASTDVPPRDIGADIDAVETATAGVVSGSPPPPPPDTTPPVISAVSASVITSSGATITWTTDEPSDSQVEYGTTTAYGSSTVLNTAMATSHSQTLSGLTPSTLYHYRVKSRDAAGNLAISGDFTFTTLAAADTTPPTVSITAPASGSTVSGTITVSANASDDVGVVGVQFKLDGVNLGAEDTAAPYEISWNTTTTGNGSHTLTAVARDGAGNSATSAAVTVTVSNDTAAPLISSVAASNISSSGATITWTTDEPSDSQVEYGTTTAYGSSTVLNTAMATSHSQTLSGLTPSTLYHYRVKSRDAAGNLAVSGDFTFTTFAASGIRSPFTGTPFAVPGTFQAEDFDLGGEGVAYHDMVAGNAGGLYRPNEDVDIVTDGGTGYRVNNIQTGEWISYSINVAVAGTYRIEANVSSQFTTSRFHIEIDGVDRTGPITVPNTGSWTTFQWVGVGGVSLSVGQHILKIVSEQEYFDLDAIRVVAQRAPFTGTPFAVPGTFQAEDFDLGGEGLAYHDMVPGNAGGEYRPNEDVDIVLAEGNGTGYRVNNIETGEWLTYSINVATAGTYTIEANVSSQFLTSMFHIEIDDVNVSGTILVPMTGTWSTFQWVGVSGVNLTAGGHVLKIFSEQQYFDLDAIRIQ